MIRGPAHRGKHDSELKYIKNTTCGWAGVGGGGVWGGGPGGRLQLTLHGVLKYDNLTLRGWKSGSATPANISHGGEKP